MPIDHDGTSPRARVVDGAEIIAEGDPATAHRVLDHPVERQPEVSGRGWCC
jgi:hypothetical protein